MVVPKSRGRTGRQRADAGGADVLGLLDRVLQRVDRMEAALTRVRELVEGQAAGTAKEWYTTAELAEALGVSQYTVQARWCADGRIECQKDPDTQKWRIPAKEYARLDRGGSPRSGRKG